MRYLRTILLSLTVTGILPGHLYPGIQRHTGRDSCFHRCRTRVIWSCLHIDMPPFHGVFKNKKIYSFYYDIVMHKMLYLEQVRVY